MFAIKICHRPSWRLPLTLQRIEEKKKSILDDELNKKKLEKQKQCFLSAHLRAHQIHCSPNNDNLDFRSEFYQFCLTKDFVLTNLLHSHSTEIFHIFTYISSFEYANI